MIARLKHRNGYLEAGPGVATKLMALIGSSSAGDYVKQLEKLQALGSMLQGPDIIADLSIEQVASPLWTRVIADTTCVAATLPIYSVVAKQDLVDRSKLIDIATEQIESGVGLLTIHPTATLELITAAQKRLVPWTSRGGGIVIRDMLKRGANENVYLNILPELVTTARKHGAALSIGATFRSANIFDSMDDVQTAEIAAQCNLASQISASGVGVIIESPGHSRPRDIKRVARLLTKDDFPIMPLGPIPTDTAIGQDHISAAIGATLLGLEGCAHILACVTREEHTGGIPSFESTIESVQAARVAAHVIDVEVMDDYSADAEIAADRAQHHTCSAGRGTRGCPRCSVLCPL
jgi:phosphomethylpyrimidine synthase